MKTFVAFISHDEIIGTVEMSVTDGEIIDLSEMLRGCGLLKDHEELAIVDDLEG